LRFSCPQKELEKKNGEDICIVLCGVIYMFPGHYIQGPAREPGLGKAFVLRLAQKILTDFMKAFY
jgi:hypothetical protein